MRTDSSVAFVPIGAPLSLVAAAGSSIPSTKTVDLLGSGVGTAPANIIGNASVFGTDMGVGGLRPELNISVGTAFATATSATLNVQLQAAPDQGAAGAYQPGTWQTIVESGQLTAAQLAAGTVIFRNPFPPAFPANLSPRYMRLLFVTPAGASFTAGTIASALVTEVRDDQANKFAAANYTVR